MIISSFPSENAWLVCSGETLTGLIVRFMNLVRGLCLAAFTNEKKDPGATCPGRYDGLDRVSVSGDPPGNTRLLWPDLMRIVAMTGIVGYHLLGIFPGLKTTVFPGVFTEFGTMVFVFLAGFFAVDRKGRTIGQYYKTRFLSILLPYLEVSLLLLAAKCVTEGVPQDVFLWLLQNLLTGGATPTLWFVPMIAVFFLFAPFWTWIPQRIRLMLLGVGLIVCVGLLERGKYMELGKNSMYFVCYFLAGMESYLHRSTFESFVAKAFPVFCILFPLSLVLLYFCFESQVMTLAKLLYSLVLIGASIRFFPADAGGVCSQGGFRRVFPGGIGRTAAAVSGCCYTVYLIHNTWIGQIVVPVSQRIPSRFLHLPLFIILTVLTMIILVCLVLMAKRLLILVGIKKTRFIIGA
ncbi:MAG: acyltransferase [Lentisphaeria bacterium]|nr:acyltransferase [Lentisphaeria bacterium]